MARSALTPVSSQQAGSAISYTSVTAANGAILSGHGGDVKLLINNPGGSPATVTVVTGGTVAGLAVADQAIVVPAGATYIAGPFPTGPFNQPGTTDLYIDTSATVNICPVY